MHYKVTDINEDRYVFFKTDSTEMYSSSGRYFLTSTSFGNIEITEEEYNRIERLLLNPPVHIPLPPPANPWVDDGTHKRFPLPQWPQQPSITYDAKPEAKCTRTRSSS